MNTNETNKKHAANYLITIRKLLADCEAKGDHRAASAYRAMEKKALEVMGFKYGCLIV